MGVYDKLEIGVQFNDSINDKIQRFVNGETGEKLNPFAPEEVDLYAEFWVEIAGTWFGPKRANGFYYQEFERSPDQTHHDTIDTPHDFRIRFTPPVIGDYRCQVKAVAAGYDTINAYEFTFECVSSSKKGFLQVGSNKRYFTRGGEPFYPVGQNIFGSYHDSDATAMTSIPEYLYYYDKMKELSLNGANYFRHIMCPWSTDIEFEHLGDYSNRMVNGWEMDNMIDSAEAYDLMMHLNLAIHYTFDRPTALHGKRYWDWATAGDSLVNPVTPPEYGCFNSNDSGYCYRRELDLEDPQLFFTDPTAISYYKKRLRYMTARWGYSTSIGVMELLSEANHAAISSYIVWEPGVSCHDTAQYRPYDEVPDFPKDMDNWHNEMASYLKDDLKVSHPICANYTGPTDLEKGDSTYRSPYIDLSSYNEYRVQIDKYQDSYIVSEEKFHNPSHEFYADKPLMHSEYGLGSDAMYLCDNNSTFIRRIRLTPFTGLAAMGLTWDDPFNLLNNWHHFEPVADFLEGIPLDAENYQAYPVTVTYDRTVEVFQLRNDETGGLRIIGAVSNRTYNFYTQADSGTYCANADNFPELEHPDNMAYLTATDFTSSERIVFLNDLGLSTGYKLHWFDPADNSLIETQSVTSNAYGQIFLDYPDITGDETRPIVYFKLFPASETSFLTPMESDSVFTNDQNPISPMGDKDETLGTVEITDWSQVQPVIMVAPNPTKDRVQVQISTDQLRGSQWILCNSLGVQIKKGKVLSPNFSIDLSVYQSGLYYLTIENAQDVIKIVKTN